MFGDSFDLLSLLVGFVVKVMLLCDLIGEVVVFVDGFDSVVELVSCDGVWVLCDGMCVVLVV